MKKFIVLYHAPKGAMEKMADVSPEDAKKGMEAWMMWGEKCGAGMVDMGAPLSNGQIVQKTGASPSASTVVGYSVLQANSMNEAVAMLKGHPHLEWMDSCQIEVHEAMPHPGM